MDDNNSSCLLAARNEGSVNRCDSRILQWKNCILEATLLKPRSHRLVQSESPAGRKLDKTSVENFRYFFRRRGTTRRVLFVVASSPGVTIFPSPVVVLLVDTVRRCFARRNGVKLENNGSLAHQILRLKEAAGRFPKARFSFCDYSNNNDTDIYRK